MGIEAEFLREGDFRLTILRSNLSMLLISGLCGINPGGDFCHSEHHGNIS